MRDTIERALTSISAAAIDQCRKAMLRLRLNLLKELNLLRKIFNPNIQDWKDMDILEKLFQGVVAASLIALPLLCIGGLAMKVFGALFVVLAQ